MKVTELALPGVLMIEPRIFDDDRGSFLETYNADRYRDAGIHDNFVQDNISRSKKGVLRGLHFQRPHDQAKLVQVLAGEVFDVVVDIRRASPNFSKWVGVTLDAKTRVQIYIPKGFAHAMCVLSDEALFSYKVGSYYDPASEHSLLWNDPKIGIEWPINKPILNEKDSGAASLGDFPEDKLPVFGE